MKKNKEKRRKMMFDYSKEAFGIVIGDLKKFVFGIGFSVQLTVLLYSILSVVFNWGNWIVNLIFAAISLVTFICFCVGAKKKKKEKKAINNVRRIAREIKLGIKTITLILTVYGMFVAINSLSLVTVVLAAFSVLGWVVSVCGELLLLWVEKRKELIFAGVKLDFPTLNELQAAIAEKKGEPLPPPTKQEEYLMKVVEKKRQTQAALKQAIAVQKKALLQAKKAEKNALKAVKKAEKANKKAQKAKVNAQDAQSTASAANLVAVNATEQLSKAKKRFGKKK